MIEIWKLRRAYERARNAEDRKLMDRIAQAISYAISGYPEYAMETYKEVAA
ncbi:hypothetical protein [Burkholderia ubonensis]|uniref:hypothetical protein n=1 Tax=Burkholderia ubonensis TaxID=101571 RepID=UPI0012FA76DC|nr:hypothetical protein [Burkholderia ubonensis]